MPSYFTTSPSLRQGPSITPRNIFATATTAIYISPGFAQIDGTRTRDTGQAGTTNGIVSLLRNGLILGKTTSVVGASVVGKYRESIIGVLHHSGSTAATTFNLAPAVATEVQRLITLDGTSSNFIIASPTTAGGTVVSTTVSATSATTGASDTSSYMTISASINVATVIGGLVMPADGAQNPITVLSGDTIPVDDVLDYASNPQDVALRRFLVGGDLLSTNITNLLVDDFGTTVDAGVVTWLKQQLNTTTNGNSFSFSDNR